MNITWQRVSVREKQKEPKKIWKKKRRRGSERGKHIYTHREEYLSPVLAVS